MGTLGGNVMLDTRCQWYNQTYFWRQALGFCLKKDGTLCHVVASGRKCVAAASNDTVVAACRNPQIGALSAADSSPTVGISRSFRSVGTATVAPQSHESDSPA